MANPYPALITDANSETRIAGQVNFTDPTNQPGSVAVRGPYSFTHSTPSLDAGVAFYTPTIGDWLIDAWISITTAFDGTTPTADLGQFTGAFGLFGAGLNGTSIDLTQADAASTFTSGLFVNLSAGPGALTLADDNVYIPGAPPQYGRIVPGKFVSATPLLLVASRDGTKGGTAINSTVGAASVYIITATPAAF